MSMLNVFKKLFYESKRNFFELANDYLSLCTCECFIEINISHSVQSELVEFFQTLTLITDLFTFIFRALLYSTHQIIVDSFKIVRWICEVFTYLFRTSNHGRFSEFIFCLLLFISIIFPKSIYLQSKIFPIFHIFPSLLMDLRLFSFDKSKSFRYFCHMRRIRRNCITIA